MAANPIIVMWTTPRSRSTAFERMMIERGDHLVIDEPFSARYYFSTESRSGRFGESEPGETGEAVLADLRRAAVERPVFVKDMAYHATGLLTEEFLANFTNTFLVRDPTAAISSLARKWPDFTTEEAGYDALGTAYELVRTLADSPPPVIEADELASDAPSVVAAWCAAVGIPFMADALTWEPGMVEEWKRWQDWYEGVAQSTGFLPPSEIRPSLPGPSRDAEPAGNGAGDDPMMADSISAARPVYDRLARVTLADSS